MSDTSKRYIPGDLEKMHSTRHRKVSKSSCYYVPVVVQCRKDGRVMKSILYKHHIKRCDECKNGEKPEKMVATNLVAGQSKLEQYTLSKIATFKPDDYS